MKKFRNVKTISLAILCLVMCLGNVFTSYAARTVKLVGTSGGTVKVAYLTGESNKNGYHSVDKSKVVISYTPPESYEGCSDVGLTHFGLATDITKPTTDASETQIYPGAGWTCNGHTGSGTEWVHYFAAATVPANLQKDVRITQSLTVSLEDYKKASYIWGGPGLSEGDGVKNNKYGWVMTYCKLPAVDQIVVPPNADETGPKLNASVVASGTTDTAANGSIWGTSATITATAKDNESKPSFIDLYFSGSKVGIMASNSENTKTITITGNYVVASNGQYTIKSEDMLGNPSEIQTNVNCIDLTPPTIQSYALDSQTPAKSHILTVTAIDSAVGLAAQAYSWDNGATWTNSNKKTVTANGSYTVKVRDKLGNTAAKSINVNNIDTIPPVIGELKAEPDGTTAQDDNGKTWGTKGKLTVKATDEGLGLADKAYSWDGGATWMAENTLTVTENKEYMAIVRDKADNRDSRKTVVDFVDLIVPKITDFSPDSTDWAQSHVLTVTARDHESGLANEAYSWDGGQTWTADNTLTVTENGTYKVIVRDRVGNGNIDGTEVDPDNPGGDEGKDNIEVIVIETIDTTSPQLEQSQTPTDWTNDCVRLDVKAIDEGSGLAEQAYSWDGGQTWTTESSHTVYVNGNYSVIVRDKADNRATAHYEVTNIDKVEPTVKITQNPTDWTNQDVILTAAAQDLESGLADHPYSWDGGVTWTVNSSYKATQNGKYIFIARDKAGNQTVTDYEVTNIDKVKPVASVVRISPGASEKWYVGEAVLLVRAKDTDSGLAAKAYSWDKGKTWVKSAKKTIKKEGTYTVMVLDKAGNITTCKCKISKDKFIPEPPVVKPPVIPPVVKEVPDPISPKPKIVTVPPQETPEPSREENVTEKELPKAPEPVEELEEEKESEIIVDMDMDKSEGNTRKEKWKPFKMFERIAASALKALVIVCLLFLIFLLFKTIPVYGLMEEGSYKLLGRAVIRKKKEAYFVKVSKGILDRGETSKYKLRFGKNFVKRKEDGALTIQLPEEQTVDTVIKRDVPFEYSE